MKKVEKNILRFAAMIASLSACTLVHAGMGESYIDKTWDFFPQLPGTADTKYVDGDKQKITLSPEQSRIVTLEKEIHALAEKRDYSQALAKLKDLESEPARQPADTSFLYRTRLALASQSNDMKLEVETIKTLLDNNMATDDEKPAFQRFLAGQYFLQKNYAAAIATARTAQGQSMDDSLEKIIIDSHIMNNDYAAAAGELDRIVRYSEASHRAPSSETLQLLVKCNLKAGNQAAYMASIEKYLSYYSDSGYWAELLNSLVSSPGFSERLSMDVYRLMYATGQFTQGRELEDIAQQALSGGYAGFGAQVVEDGIKSGKIHGGNGSKQAQMLREKAKRAVEAELAAMAKEESKLRGNTDPNMLATIGYAYIDHGKAEKGIDYLNKALASGRLKYPDDAKLHLAMAYAKTGQSQAAVDTLKGVKGNDGTAQLAHYWTIYLMQAANLSSTTTASNGG